MEIKFMSISTLTTCISLLSLRRDTLQRSIDSYANSEDVPSWMYDFRNELNDSLEELQNCIK